MRIRHPLTIAGIVTLVLLAVLLLVLFSPWAAPQTPAVKLPELQDRLPEQAGPAIPRELVQVEVNPLTVQSVIATLNRPDSYYRTIHVVSFWDGGSREQTVRVWAKSGMLRLNLQSQGETEKNYLMADGALTLWYGEDSANRWVRPGDDPHLADDLQNIPTYEDILALDPSAIRQAGCTVTQDGKWRILVTAEDSDFGYLDIYYISLDTGLLEMAEQWEGNTLLYRMTAGEADLSAPDDQVFLLPETLS